MIDIENYRKSDGEIDYCTYNHDILIQKKNQLENAILTFDKACELAKLNSFNLVQHSAYHFSLTYLKEGKRQWRLNLYPSNQRLWPDKKCGKVPFLKLPATWTLLDVVSSAIIANQINPVKEALAKARTK